MRRSSCKGRVEDAADARELGQATLEYALVLFALVATLASLAAVWHASREGAFVRLAEESSSHRLGEGSYAVALQDLLLY